MTATATVLVCVRNDWRVLRLLDSLNRQSFDADRLRVVVVCSGREDYGVALDGFRFDLRVIRCGDVRLSVKRNIGLEHVESPYYLTTDADCVAQPDWVATLVRRLERADASVVGVGGGIDKYAADTMTQRYGITVNDGQAALNYLPALHLPYIAGANAAFRTGPVRNIGGYDEDFLCGDDVDLCYRLGLAGGRLEVDPDARIYHEDVARLLQHYRRFRYLAIDQALLFKKYRAASGRRWTFDTYPFRRLGLATRMALRDLPAVAKGRWHAPKTALVTSVEAFGVLAGDLQGAWRHRVLYL